VTTTTAPTPLDNTQTTVRLFGKSLSTRLLGSHAKASKQALSE